MPHFRNEYVIPIFLLFFWGCATTAPKPEPSDAAEYGYIYSLRNEIQPIEQLNKRRSGPWYTFKTWKLSSKLASQSDNPKADSLAGVTFKRDRMWHIYGGGVLQGYTEKLCQPFPDIWFTTQYSEKGVKNLMFNEYDRFNKHILKGFRMLVEANCAEGQVEAIRLHIGIGKTFRNPGGRIYPNEPADWFRGYLVIYEGTLIPEEPEYRLIHDSVIQYEEWVKEKERIAFANQQRQAEIAKFNAQSSALFKMFAAVMLESARKQSLESGDDLSYLLSTYGRNQSVASALKDVLPGESEEALGYYSRWITMIMSNEFSPTSIVHENFRESIIQQIKKDHPEYTVPATFLDLVIDLQAQKKSRLKP